MLDTQGNGFKNQGDCVSFYATDGKNLGSVAPGPITAKGHASRPVAPNASRPVDSSVRAHGSAIEGRTRGGAIDGRAHGTAGHGPGAAGRG
jgi:hypothetical protein